MLVGSEQPHRIAVEAELVQRAVNGGIARRTFNVGEKLGCRKAGTILIAFELRHVDAIRGKPAKPLVKRRRNIAHLEQERRLRRAVTGIDIGTLGGPS